MDIILPGDKGRIWFPQSINLTQSPSLQRSNSVGRKELTQAVECRRHMGEKLCSQVNLKSASFPVLRKCLYSLLRKKDSLIEKGVKGSSDHPLPPMMGNWLIIHVILSAIKNYHLHKFSNQNPIGQVIWLHLAEYVICRTQVIYVKYGWGSQKIFTKLITR